MFAYILDEDLRSKELKKICWDSGYKVTTSLNELKQCDFAYMGVRGKAIESLELKEGSRIYTLVYDEKLEKRCLNQKAKYEYLYSDFELIQGNTYLTSEALIGYMIIDNDCSINDSNVLIFGYGNCGKDLAMKLKSLGANVTISNRGDVYKNSVLKKGLNYVMLSDICLEGYDFIINTVPCNILSRDLLAHLNRNSKIYDIASTPYGVAKEDRINNYYILNSLPSKYAYKSAAKLLYKAIMKKEDNYVRE